MRGKVKAVCTSEERGVQKRDVQSGVFCVGWGLEGDAHGGDWHRQVSLLSYDKVEKFNEQGAGVSHGDFGENLLVSGIDFAKLPLGSRLQCGECVLELTQIGKECHAHCQIYHKMGDCIMPREGVFARVIKNGLISVGDLMEKQMRAAILVLSDRGAGGEREDSSGPLITKMLEAANYHIVKSVLLPDDKAAIEEELIALSDKDQADLILTSGGTGFSQRDVTPEATLAIAERHVPGISEAIRAHSLQITGRAMLSRGVSVLRGSSLIVNLPGSPKAVRESLEYALPHFRHGLEILRGEIFECAGGD